MIVIHYFRFGHTSMSVHLLSGKPRHGLRICSITKIGIFHTIYTAFILYPYALPIETPAYHSPVFRLLPLAAHVNKTLLYHLLKVLSIFFAPPRLSSPTLIPLARIASQPLSTFIFLTYCKSLTGSVCCFTSSSLPLSSFASPLSVLYTTMCIRMISSSFYSTYGHATFNTGSITYCLTYPSFNRSANPNVPILSRLLYRSKHSTFWSKLSIRVSVYCNCSFSSKPLFHQPNILYHPQEK